MCIFQHTYNHKINNKHVLGIKFREQHHVPLKVKFSSPPYVEISAHLYWVVVEAGVVTRLCAGLPGLWCVDVTTALHALYKPPALDMVKVARPVSAADIEARVHGNTCPRVRAYFDTCGRVAQVRREHFS